MAAQSWSGEAGSGFRGRLRFRERLHVGEARAADARLRDVILVVDALAAGADAGVGLVGDRLVAVGAALSDDLEWRARDDLASVLRGFADLFDDLVGELELFWGALFGFANDPRESAGRRA